MVSLSAWCITSEIMAQNALSTARNPKVFEKGSQARNERNVFKKKFCFPTTISSFNNDFTFQHLLGKSTKIQLPQRGVNSLLCRQQASETERHCPIVTMAVVLSSLHGTLTSALLTMLEMDRWCQVCAERILRRLREIVKFTINLSY